MRRLLPVLFILCSTSIVWGESKTVDPFVMPSARFSALGGVHAAMADDFYSIFMNPAGFSNVKSEFSAAEITVSTFGPVFEIVDLFRNNSGSVEDLDLSGIVGPGGFAAGFDLGGPLSLGWVGNGLGIGIFNRVRTTAAISGAYLKPVMSAELLFVGGYGLRIYNLGGISMDFGFLTKGFFRGIVDMKTAIFSVDSLDPFESQFYVNLGFGIDLGLTISYEDMLSLAVVCHDAYSPVLVNRYDALSDFGDGAPDKPSYATVKRVLNFGLSYNIRSAFLDRYFSRVTVMLDHHDFLDLFSLIPRNAILNVSLGVELVLLNPLTLRFGITDALPALGFGLNLSFMTLDFAIFGKELGLDPGKHSVYAMSFGLLFRY